MKIKDLLICFPSGILAIVTKSIKTNIQEESKEYIEKNHLYHCTNSKETANKIIQSSYLKPATGLFKYINSYGKPAACMFAGLPSIDNSITNLTKNPYENPYMIMNAVEIDIKKEEINKNYKIRPFSDEAILYEGYCKLPNDRVKAVELVADLRRDEQGVPIIDNNTKKPIIEIRKRTPEEILESPDKYIPKPDYLQYINERRKQLGYLDGNSIVSKSYNYLNTILPSGRIECNLIEQSIKKNFTSTIKSIFSRFTNAKTIDENAQSKIERLTQGTAFLERKNPYAEKKFALAVSKFNQQGLQQYDIKEILSKFTNSRDGLFARDKYNQIRNLITRKGKHGAEHSSRVFMLSFIIAKEEGMLDFYGDRAREILSYASYIHDIGRIADNGPHAKRGSRLAAKLDFQSLKGSKLHEEDKDIIRLLVEGHEGKDKDIDKLLLKYKINEEDKKMTKDMLLVLKDADALDRSRLTINTPLATFTDLDPKYLRYNTSKRLMDFSYGLEYLTHNIKDFNDILEYRNQNQEKHYYNKQKEYFEELSVRDGQTIEREESRQTINKSVELNRGGVEDNRYGTDDR